MKLRVYSRTRLEKLADKGENVLVESVGWAGDTETGVGGHAKGELFASVGLGAHVDVLGPLRESQHYVVFGDWGPEEDGDHVWQTGAEGDPTYREVHAEHGFRAPDISVGMKLIPWDVRELLDGQHMTCHRGEGRDAVWSVQTSLVPDHAATRKDLDWANDGGDEHAFGLVGG